MKRKVEYIYKLCEVYCIISTLTCRLDFTSAVEITSAIHKL